MAIAAPIVVTGSAGRIGQAVVQELKRRGLAVRGFDLAPTAGADESIVGSITDASAVQQAMCGTSALIHLAATPDDDDFFTKLLPNNIIGVYQVMDAARAAGVKRVILASSGQVVWWQRQRGPWPVSSDALPSPRGWYAAAKCFLEAAGQIHAENYGMTVIAARLGWCPRTRVHVDELARTEWGKDVYLSPGDAGRFFACAVTAALPPQFAVLYAVSKPLRTLTYDLALAKNLIGYEPLHTWPEGLPEC